MSVEAKAKRCSSRFSIWHPLFELDQDLSSQERRIEDPWFTVPSYANVLFRLVIWLNYRHRFANINGETSESVNKRAKLLSDAT